MTDKKVCLLTGAGGVLGAEFCRRFASKYDIVAVCGQRPVSGVPDQNRCMVDPLDVKGGIPENRNALFTVHADLAQRSDIDRIVELSMARHGRIDVVVNAAVHAVWASMLESDAVQDSAERQFLINVVTPLRLSIAVARAFWRDRPAENAARGRCVVNISSTAGVNIYPGTGQSVYSASKAALNYLTCHMAEEFARISVRVNGIAPNSFPSIIATATVADAIDLMIESGPSGKTLVLDQHRQYYTPA